MIAKMTSGSLGLLAFSGSILVGLWCGNDSTSILSRALSALVVFLLIGGALGWIAQKTINEHLLAQHDRLERQMAAEVAAQMAELTGDQATLGDDESAASSRSASEKRDREARRAKER